MRRRLSALIRKEFLQLWRDSAILFLILYAFTADIYLAAQAYNLEVKSYPVAVCDRDGSARSRELAARFREPTFLTRRVFDEGRLTRGLETGEFLMAVVIPEDFARRLAKGEQARVQILCDGTNAYATTIALAWAGQIVAGFGAEVALERLQMPERRLAKVLPAVESRTRLLYNPNANHVWFSCLSELLSMMTLLAILLPAAALVREKEYGTVEQLLVTPLRGAEILISKIAPMVAVIVLFTFIAVFSILRPVYEVPLLGSVALFFAATGCYVFAAAGLGLLVATVSRNQPEALLTTIVVMMPILFLSDIFSPVEDMPAAVEALSVVSPLGYYIRIAYAVFFKGAGLGLLWRDFLLLAGLGGLLFAAASYLVGRRIRAQ